MDGFFIHYVEANIICIIIFMILLLHDVFGVDRQEKQLKYDRTLIAFMFYFAADCLWAAIVAQKIPVTRFIVVVDALCIYLGMVLITYTWLDYVMAIEQVENRNRPLNRFAISFPFLISTLILIITYIVNPGFLINEAQEIQDGFNYFLVGVPYIYLFAVMYYTIRKAISEENPVERRKHLLIGLFPLLVIVGGLIEMLFFPYEPIFCYCSTILMLVFFIQMIEKQISVDPLTGLNNRGQLLRYVGQNSNMRRENRLTFVIMIDINDFKMINDTYGHAQGDKALIVLSDSLKKVISNHNTPVFLGRYGGDEFIIIFHPFIKEEVDPFVREIRQEIEKACKENNTPFTMTVGIGYDELKMEPDTFQKCMQRADKNLYQDKRNIKLNR